MTDILPRLSADLVDRYRIERELGGGGMSRVFLAEELALGRKVVIKVLPPDLGAGVNVDRFRREIHLAASLQHPHVVPLLAAGSADGLLYYTMPLVEGESLRAKLAREGELPVPEVVRLMRDVADALAYAHDRGVLHRDIKPDNILVSRQHALVTDFGVAKALSAAAGDGSGTTEGVALGTPAYMAPEQAAADPHTDHRADLYALGATAYEMLTSNTPFPGLTGQAALAAHATRRPPPVTDVRPSIPPALAELVMRCLEKHPADRPQSANEVLQQLDVIATPSGGTTPTLVVSRPSLSRGWRRGLLLAGAVAAALVLSLFALRRPRAGSTLDANLLAVAPFDAVGRGLELWREGLVDILSRNLDGAGPLKTVSPTVVIRRWKGRADPASAAALGHGIRAGLVVFGNLIAATRDSVRLRASVLDVGRNRTVAEVELRGPTERMDDLTDSLTVSLLRELGRTRDLVAVRTATLRATSLPALKAFLNGERLYRGGKWDSAQVAYREALTHDSLFVPAIRRLGLSLSWRAVGDQQYVPYLKRAGELNHGLPRRDSLLVLADSVFAALQPGDLPTSTFRALAARLFSTLQNAVRLYPEDPEVWYILGEARYHQGSIFQVTPREMLDAFDRAIALDSNFTPAYAHPTELGLELEGLRGWHRYADRYLALRPADDYATGANLLQSLFQATEMREVDSLLGSANLDQLVGAVFSTWHFLDSAETAVRVARALQSKGGHSPGWVGNPTFRRQVLAGVLGLRGHLRASQNVLGEDDRLSWLSSWPAEIALVGGRDADSVDAMFGRWLKSGPLWSAEEFPLGGPPGPLFFALPWWAIRRDTLSLALYTRRADSAQRVVSGPIETDITRYASEAAQAYSALARGDTAAALRRFEALPHDVFWGALERATEGQLLARRGRDAEALKQLEGAFPYDWWGPVRVLTSLEVARLAERTGQTDRATDAYQFVLDAWRHADPELQHYVEEARQGLARLTSEPR